MLTRSDIERLVQAVHRDVAANRVGVAPRSPRHVERLQALQARHAAEGGPGADGSPASARIVVPS